MRADRLRHVGVGVIGLGGQEIGAERILAVILQDRNEPVPVETDQQRPVVRDELGEEAEQEQREEHPHRPVAAAVLAEDGQAASRQRRKRHRRASKSMRGSTTV